MRNDGEHRREWALDPFAADQKPPAPLAGARNRKRR
jgi:hypothetical protein